VIDRYGRFLAFISQDRPKADRRPPYNDRMLAVGAGLPYFIWPNLDPWRTGPLVNRVPDPADPLGANPGKLGPARHAVAQARTDGLGVFSVDDPLRLAAFELRYLSRTSGGVRREPDRWVLDLSANTGRLLKPERYFEIPNSEDRLFVPAEFVPLFVSKGWNATRRRPTSPAHWRSWRRPMGNRCSPSGAAAPRLGVPLGARPAHARATRDGGHGGPAHLARGGGGPVGHLILGRRRATGG
jgi:hypothetical protein